MTAVTSLRPLWYHGASSPHCPQGGRGFPAAAAGGAGRRRTQRAAELPRQGAHGAGAIPAAAAGVHRLLGQ